MAQSDLSRGKNTAAAAAAAAAASKRTANRVVEKEQRVPLEAKVRGHGRHGPPIPLHVSERRLVRDVGVAAASA